MNNYEIIGKLYVENVTNSIKLKECEKIMRENAHNSVVKDNALRSKYLTKIGDAQKYVTQNKDTVPEKYFNELMEILERRTDK